MHRRLRRACAALTEQSCARYSSLAALAGYSGMDMLITRATPRTDAPLDDRLVLELKATFSATPSSSKPFALSFTRRFGRTRCWRVALKCLALLHCLLRSLTRGHPFPADLLWARSNGLLSLYPCDFQAVTSSSSSYDFTIFVQSYARFLDEALECYHCFVDDSARGDTDVVVDDMFPNKMMNEVRRALETVPLLQSLTDRAVDCRPTGTSALRSPLVRSVMRLLARDTFACYGAVRRDLALVLDNLFQVQYRSCIAGLGVYRTATAQTGRLVEFHEVCRRMRVCGAYEYPLVERIPQIHVRALESLVDATWQLTETESSSSSSSSSSLYSSSLTGTSSSSPTSTQVTEEGRSECCWQVGPSSKGVVVSLEWERFEEEDEGNSWEDLLEASVNLTPVDNSRTPYDHEEAHAALKNKNNPFYVGYATPYLYGRGRGNRVMA